MSYHFCCFRTLNQDTCPINVFELGQEVLSVVWKMCNTDLESALIMFALCIRCSSITYIILCMDGMTSNLAWWCIVTSFRTDKISVILLISFLAQCLLSEMRQIWCLWRLSWEQFQGIATTWCVMPENQIRFSNQKEKSLSRESGGLFPLLAVSAVQIVWIMAWC